jgi:RNA polymerase sigma factor (sigma-70 family)
VVGDPAVKEPTRLPTIESVYAELRAPMVRVAYLVVGSHAVAQEIVQDAFVQLHRHFDRVHNPGGFLRTTVVRLCLTWRGRRDMELERLGAVVEPEATGEPEIDEIWDVLARLSPARRLVLVLRYYEDLSHGEIGRLVGVREATVRSRVRRGLADLRRELER